MAAMKITIVIPAFNEEENLKHLLPYLREYSAGYVDEIIVSDGGSSDATAKVAARLGATVVVSPKKGRAAQMNFGAAHAGAEIIYFLHADSYPPKNFDFDIISAINKGAVGGCFLLSFDDKSRLLKLYSVFTALKSAYVRFGDQSLFVKCDVFSAIGGFREDHIVMEDQEIVHRLKDAGNFELIQKQVITSARKYRENGIVRLQAIFSIIYFLYYSGASQQTLVHIYKSLIRTD